MKHILCLQHTAHEAPGLIERWAHLRGHGFTVLRVDEAPPVEPPAGADMLVILGGPMAVYEEDAHGWMPAEKTFIRAWLGSGRPTLGICLGSQLLAEALGGKVYPHALKEIGWFSVRLRPGADMHPLLSALPQEQVYFHWHGDTFDLPPDAQWLAESDATRYQAFAWKNHVLGLQFHPEIDASLLALWKGSTTASDLTPGPYVQDFEALWQGEMHITAITPLFFSLLDRLLAA